MAGRVGDRAINRWSLVRLLKAWDEGHALVGLGHEKEHRLAWGNRVLVPRYRNGPVDSWKALTMRQGAVLRGVLHGRMARAEREALQPRLF